MSRREHQQNEQEDPLISQSLSNIKKDEQKSSSEPQKEPQKKTINKNQFRFSVGYFLLALAVFYIFQMMTHPTQSTIEFSEFKNKVIAGEIKRVELRQDIYRGFLFSRQDLEGQEPDSSLKDANRKSVKIYRTLPVEDSSFIPLLDEHGVEYYTVPISIGAILLNVLLTWILPIGVMIGLWFFLTRRIGQMGALPFGKNRAQIVEEGEIEITFDDVAGADEAKEELEEIIDFLKNPEKYLAIGGKMPKGVLLVGPPGTGKTMLAKAVAGEAHVPFFKLSGADFVEMFVGVGAARVRDLFKQAREKSPCIVFIDELDAIGKSRSNAAMGNDEREQTLNQLLVEMDGFGTQEGVIILAATNRPQILDPALLRPGRFDRQVLVDRPDLKGREAILKVHAQKIVLDKTVQLDQVAQATAGFAGADLANLINEAALLAVRAKREKVMQQDLEEALEKVIAGLQKRSRLINPEEKKRVAYHETGHALVAALTPNADPVRKISIIPRGAGALGYTMQVPTEDRFLMTEDDLLGRIDVLLGGRAAEEIIFGQISTGASDDLSRATGIARQMITDYGMSEKFRNTVLGKRGAGFLGESEGPAMREYSESTQQYIDEQIAAILNERYTKTLALLKQKQTLLERITNKLLEIETLDANAFQAMLSDSTETEIQNNQLNPLLSSAQLN